MKDPLHEETLTSDLVYDGCLLKVYRDEVHLPDGKQGVREYIRHPGAVVVIPVLPDGRLVFERQFRYPVGQAFLELPAGKLDPGEDLLACARRELQEETGYVSDTWRHLGVLHPCIGYSNERIEIFLATGLTHVGHAWDEGEFLELLTLGLDEARAAVFDGRITDAKTITALFWAERELAGGIPSS
ncbi:NUDIX hydrolase [Zoogloea sp.]|uniref:NUDIX domain-containing protein n=1 Tax=Zoogloea sp. TaxID=49181 RepID=UPI00261719CB|nr:NUDIX hydrolase [Zoogloea sp.]MDD3354655.1 NUDIX hydrolase [Zoogloea sp.]